MGTYNATTIRGLAGRQAKANQQSVMLTSDFSKYAKPGLKPTPRQLRWRELKLEIASLEVEISSLVCADDYGMTANRSALVKAIAQYLATSALLQKDTILPEIPLGDISAKLNNESGTSIGFSGCAIDSNLFGGNALSSDASLKAAELNADVYALVTDTGMRADSVVEFEVYDRDYIYLNSRIWQDFSSTHDQSRWGYFLNHCTPMYGIKRQITIMKDETVEEKLRICRDSYVSFNETRTALATIPEIGQQLSLKYGLKYDDQEFGCLLRHVQPVTKDDAMTNLVAGSIDTISETPSVGFYRPACRDPLSLHDCCITMPELDVSNRTYNTLVVEAQVIFDRCQQYYDILQDALKLYRKQQV